MKKIWIHVSKIIYEMFKLYFCLWEYNSNSYNLKRLWIRSTFLWLRFSSLKIRRYKWKITVLKEFTMDNMAPLAKRCCQPYEELLPGSAEGAPSLVLTDNHVRSLLVGTVLGPAVNHPSSGASSLLFRCCYHGYAKILPSYSDPPRPTTASHSGLLVESTQAPENIFSLQYDHDLLGFSSQLRSQYNER